MKLTVFLIYVIAAINSAFSQVKAIRVVIPPNDSVYVWNGNSIHESWGFYSPDNAVVVDFNDSDRTISGVHSMCGRSPCPNGFEINFYNNGMIESRGQYGFSTEVDSLKYVGGDGIMDYVGKNGWWFYWNEKGFLLKKESWVKGKLTATIYYTTAVMNKKKKK
jgi:hypothetical protein